MPALLPVTQLALLAVAIVGIAGIRIYPKVVLSYYAATLAAVATRTAMAASPATKKDRSR